MDLQWHGKQILFNEDVQVSDGRGRGTSRLQFNLEPSSRLNHKIFFWLVAHCRINTRSLLQRKGMQLENPYCPLCNQNAEETPLHLLWDCAFAQECWNTLIPNKRRGTSLYEETLLAIEQLPKAFAS